MKRVLIIAGGTCLGILAAVVAIAMLSRGSTDWVRSDNSDPMTDAASIEMMKPAEDGMGQLALACSTGEKPKLYIRSPVRLGGFTPETNAAERMVRYRFDTGTVQDAVGIFADDIVGFKEKSAGKGRWDDGIVQGMRSADRLAIDVNSHDGQRIVMTFDVSSAEDVLETLTADCA